MSAYLLDVSAVMALLWQSHTHHQRVNSWQEGRELAPWRPNAKPIQAATMQMCARLPLTPALSRGESEHHRPRWKRLTAE